MNYCTYLLIYCIYFVILTGRNGFMRLPTTLLLLVTKPFAILEFILLQYLSVFFVLVFINISNGCVKSLIIINESTSLLLKYVYDVIGNRRDVYVQKLQT